MPYRFLEEKAIADVAFEAKGNTLAELFESAAQAVTVTMIREPESLGRKETRSFEIRAENVEMLLFHFLQELLFLKDAEQLLFSGFGLEIVREGDEWRLFADAGGDRIDPAKQELIVDVKAVSFHNYIVEETPEGWRAEVILDV